MGWRGAQAAAMTLTLALATGARAQEQAAPVNSDGTAPATPASTTVPGSFAPCRPAGQPYQPMDEKMPCTPEKEAVPEKVTYTVPAGTKVLLQLRSAVNTKSAKAGDGVYLASTFPVVVGTRVMIPAGVYVQGVVDRVERAGRVKGRAQLDMHFTSIIFPNGSVVEIPGLVNSLPGASKQTVKDDGEGTIEQSGGKGRDAGRNRQDCYSGRGYSGVDRRDWLRASARRGADWIGGWRGGGGPWCHFLLAALT